MVLQDADQDWTLRARGIQPGNRLVIWLVAHTGFLPAYMLIMFLSLFYVIFDRRAKLCIRELRSNLGLKCSVIDYYKHFCSFGFSLIDRYTFMFKRSNLFIYERTNQKIIEKCLLEGKGVILAGAHLGDWQLAGNMLDKTVNTTVNLLRFDVDSPGVKNSLKRKKNLSGVEFVNISAESPDAVIHLVNALKRGEIVCLLGDRVLGDARNEVINFLGKPARFPSGVFSIAAATGAPVIPFFSLKTGWRKYKFIAHDPIFVKVHTYADKKKQIRSGMEQYVRILEETVRAYPYQWFNFYKYWL